MPPAADWLTAPNSLADHKTDDLTGTARSLLSSSFILLHVDHELGSEKSNMVAETRSQSKSGHTDLWFNMPSSAARTAEERQSNGATQCAVACDAPPSPSFAMPQVASSPESEKKKRKPTDLFNRMRQRPSRDLDQNHLQPESAHRHETTATKNGKLSPIILHGSTLLGSRSMPSSPSEFESLRPATATASMTRSHSTQQEDSHRYSAYAEASLMPSPLRSQRSTSSRTYFDSNPPRARRTFPEDASASTTRHVAQVDRPRPHTWLSPSEPFGDESEFHLFVEATNGLPGGIDTFSPEGDLPLQGSLFGSRRSNDVIPIPLRNSSSADTTPSSPTQPLGGWQSLGYELGPQREAESPQPSPQWSSVSTPAPTTTGLSASLFSSRDPNHEPLPSPRMENMHAVNLELERLGIEERNQWDEELPTYAQSQAAESDKRRREASARARELESRWSSGRAAWR